MAYTKQIWENLPSTNTPISADRLNHMEEGIYHANNGLIEAQNSNSDSKINPYSADYINNNFFGKYKLVTDGSAVKTGRQIDGHDEWIKRVYLDALPGFGATKAWDTGIIMTNLIMTDLNIVALAGSGNWFPLPNIGAANIQASLTFEGKISITCIEQGNFNGRNGYAEIKYYYTS